MNIKKIVDTLLSEYEEEHYYDVYQCPECGKEAIDMDWDALGTNYKLNKFAYYCPHCGKKVYDRKLTRTVALTDRDFKGITKINEQAYRVTMPHDSKQAINNRLAEVSGNPYTAIPLSFIMAVLNENGYVLVNQDGSVWNNALAGVDGQTLVSVGVLPLVSNTGKYSVVTNTSLYLSWNKTDSGNWEIVVHLS